MEKENNYYYLRHEFLKLLLLFSVVLICEVKGELYIRIIENLVFIKFCSYR